MLLMYRFVRHAKISLSSRKPSLEISSPSSSKEFVSVVAIRWFLPLKIKAMAIMECQIREEPNKQLKLTLRMMFAAELVSLSFFFTNPSRVMSWGFFLQMNLTLVWGMKVFSWWRRIDMFDAFHGHIYLASKATSTTIGSYCTV